jgi:hypothetical protein
MKTTKRPNQKQLEILRDAIQAAEAAAEAAAELREAERTWRAAEAEALAVLRQIGDEPRTIRDDSGKLRRLSIDLTRSFRAAGTREDRLQFAELHNLKTTAPDCSTATLKTMAGAAIARGILEPVPRIAIE